MVKQIDKIEEEKITDLEIAKKLVSLSHSARSRGIDFNVSFGKLKRVLTTRTCYFSGVRLNRIDNHDNQLSIDRIDNSKGYVDSNIVACSKRINLLKGQLTVKDISYIYKGLKKKKII